MNDLDSLFTTLPCKAFDSTPIYLGSSDNHNRTDFITDAGFLDAFYRGRFHLLRSRLLPLPGRNPLQRQLDLILPSPIRGHPRVESMRRLELLVKGLDWWAVISIKESSVMVEFGIHHLRKGRTSPAI